ncbi:hypothetical protein [Anaerotruncus rubiinfantis]|uniref:hypothetical protein n=1 Tax=Anaerotruncus rubiinfantis TaxID=1720200 RepID=UPI0034A14AA9
MRHNLNHIDEANQLLRRKEIYEELHPETRQGMRNGQTSKTAAVAVLESKSFVADTSSKTGMAERTIRDKIQVAKNLTPEVKAVVKESGISEKNALKLARIKDEDKQKEAAQRPF